MGSAHVIEMEANDGVFNGFKNVQQRRGIAAAGYL